MGGGGGLSLSDCVEALSDSFLILCAAWCAGLFHAFITPTVVCPQSSSSFLFFIKDDAIKTI